jgi:hypothetical protein
MGRLLHATSDRSVDDERANNFSWRPSKLEAVSVVACISAAGEHMTPFFVSSHVNLTVERRLKLEGSE